MFVKCIFFRGQWNLNEDIYILEMILEKGKKWSLMAKALGGRTENAVKNRFITLVRHYNKINFIKKKERKANPLETDEVTIKNIIRFLYKKENPEGSPTKIQKCEQKIESDV